MNVMLGCLQAVEADLSVPIDGAGLLFGFLGSVLRRTSILMNVDLDDKVRIGLRYGF